MNASGSPGRFLSSGSEGTVVGSTDKGGGNNSSPDVLDNSAADAGI